MTKLQKAATARTSIRPTSCVLSNSQNYQYHWHHRPFSTNRETAVVTAERMAPKSNKDNHNDSDSKNKSKNKDNRNNNYNDMVQSWFSIKDRLMDMKPGSFTSYDWQLAENLVERIRTHADFANDIHDTQQRIELIFSILDRMCDEAQALSTLVCTNRDQNNDENAAADAGPAATTTSLPVSLPLDGVILGSALLVWRDHVFSLIPRQITFSKQIAAEATESSSSSSSSPKIGPLGLLDPTSVLAMVDRYSQVGLFDPQTIEYTTILHVMRKTGDPKQVPYMAEQLLFDKMLKRSNYDPFSKYYPTNQTTAEMMEIWSQNCTSSSSNSSHLQEEALSKVEKYMTELQQSYEQTKRMDLKPNKYHSIVLMEAYSRACTNEPQKAFARISQLMDNLIKQSSSSSSSSSSSRKNTSDNLDNRDDYIGGDDDDDNHDAPTTTNDLTTVEYTRICNALTECRHPDAADKARDILNDMIEFHRQEGDKSTRKPNQYTFGVVLSAYARAGRTEDVMELLQWMESLADDSRDRGNDPSLFRPTMIPFTTLIWAFAKVGDTVGANYVFSLLLKAIQEGGEGSEYYTDRYNEHAVSGLLTAFVQSGNPTNAIKQITAIIKDLRNRFPALVTLPCYNKLLSCYGKQKDAEEGAEKAEELFHWLENQKDEGLKPDQESFLSLIFSWCRAGQPEKAEEKLRLFCGKSRRANKEIDQRMFGAVIDAWGKSNHFEAAQRATNILNFMQSLGVEPDVVSYNSAMHAWTRCKRVDPAKPVWDIFHQMGSHAKPDNHTFTALLSALSQSSHPKALYQAEDYLQNGINQFGVQPDMFHFNSVMAGWAKRNRPEKVEEIFQKGKQVLGAAKIVVSKQMHTTRVQAWSKAGNPEMASQALRDWIADFETRRITDGPGTQGFNAVLLAWSRSGHHDAAANIEMGLRQMQKYADSGRFDCYPDSFSYSAAITAYANSNRPDAGEKAVALLKETNALAATRGDVMQADIITYADAIVALVRSDKSSKRQKKILELFADLLSNPQIFVSRNKAIDYTACFNKIRVVIHTSPEMSGGEKTLLLNKLHGLELVANDNTRPRQRIDKYKV